MSNALRTILRRVPSWAQIIPVYGVIAIMIYAWTLLWFFWRLPSWLDFLNLGEILTQLAYSLATNFIESLIVLCAPVLLALLLPKKWFHDAFIARGASLSVAGLGCLMLLASQFDNKNDYPTFSLHSWIVLLILIAIAALVYLCGRIALVRRILEGLADRTSIFAYLLVPLSLISLLAVIVRLLVG